MKHKLYNTSSVQCIKVLRHFKSHLKFGEKQKSAEIQELLDTRLRTNIDKTCGSVLLAVQCSTPVLDVIWHDDMI